MLDLIRTTSLLDDFFKPTYKSHMNTNITETDEEYKLLIEVPGFKKDEIKISLDEGKLVVEASRKKEEEKKEKNYLHKEIYEGTLRRVYNMGNVSIEKMKAKLDNGILEIIIPKEEKKYLEIK